MVGWFQHVVAMENVGGLTRRQTGIRPFDWHIRQLQYPTALPQSRLSLGSRHRRKRGHSQLDPTMQLEQLDLHVDGGSQFRLPGFERSQLRQLSCLGAGRTRTFGRWHRLDGTIAWAGR